MDQIETQGTATDRDRLVDLLKKSGSSVLRDQARDFALASLGRGHSMQRQGSVTRQDRFELAALQQAIGAVAETEPILQTRFLGVGGKLATLHREVQASSLRVVETDQVGDVGAVLDEELSTLIDVSKVPGLRMVLVRSGEQDTLAATMSALVADEWTPNLLLNRVLAAYDGESKPADPSLSLRQLVLREQALLGSREYTQALEAARTRLADLPTLDLATKPRPQVLSQTRASVERAIRLGGDDPAVGSIADTALTAYALLLGRLAHQSRFGMLVRSRSDASVDGLGPLAHSSVLPVNLDECETTADLTAAVRSHRLGTSGNLPVPFADLVDALNPDRDLSHTPLAQVAFADCTSLGHGRANIAGTVGTGANVVDLTLLVSQDKGDTVFRLEYNADLFHEPFAEALLERLVSVTDQAQQDPTSRLADIEILLPGEEQRILDLSRGEQRPDAGAETIAHIVASVASSHADDVAIRFAGSALTYRELMNATREIMRQLDDAGTDSSNGPVALLMNRSPLQVAAMLACCWRGVPFLPVDLNYPAERQAFMIVNSGATTLVQDPTAQLPPGLGDLPAVKVDEALFRVAGPGPVEPTARLDSAAYVIYTSGSTGRPKAVQVSNRSVVNNLRWRQRVFPLAPGDAVLQNHSFSFDPSIWAVFWPLTVGGRIVLTEDSGAFDSSELADLAANEEVAVVGGVPSMLSVLADEPRYADCSALKYVLSGAEVLTAELVSRLRRLPQVTVANLYGPTEATIDATYWVHGGRHEVDQGAPIGRPIDNCSVFLMDDHGRPVPPGAVGELCIGGVALADGYVNAPDETERRFRDWDGPEGQTCLYLTGDLARWDEFGQLIFRGRADEQVKIRGFRVELGEIEAVATSLDEVAEFIAVATPISPSRPEMRLSGYFTWAGGRQGDETQIRTALTGVLPGHMVPSTLEALDTIPKLSSGKADRAALRRRRPKTVADTAVSDGDDNPVLKDIGNEFASALGLDRVDADTDFFEMGGTSIMLATLAGKLRLKYENELPIHAFFQLPTPRGVTKVIDELRQGGIDEMLAGRHMETMERDAELDPSVQAGSLPWASVDQPREILLTGATGYLGSYLLAALLKKTTATINCLVRGRDGADARQRLVSSLKHYDLWRDEHEDRIRVLCGDLGQPNFGLDGADWDTLASDVDVIYHNGAHVNFVYPYSALRQANVEGTRRVLQLATTTRVKAIHHISTIDSLLATHTPRPFVENDAPLENPVGVPGGYTGTKWVAEKLMNVAMSRGLPVSIYRPGLILGTIDTGVTQTSDYLLVALKGFLPMGMVPEYPRIFDTVPVDYVGNAIAEISSRPASRGRFFHFFNPAPVSIRQFCEWIQEFGFSFDIVPFEEARRAALTVQEGHPLYSLVPLIRDAEVDPQPSLDPRLMDQLRPDLECANTVEFLEGSDVSCPPMTREFAWRCMKYLVDVGYLPQPDRNPPWPGADSAS